MLSWGAGGKPPPAVLGLDSCVHCAPGIEGVEEHILPADVGVTLHKGNMAVSLQEYSFDHSLNNATYTVATSERGGVICPRLFAVPVVSKIELLSGVFQYLICLAILCELAADCYDALADAVDVFVS